LVLFSQMELQPKAFQEAEGPIGGLVQIPWQTNDVNIRIFIHKLKSTIQKENRHKKTAFASIAMNGIPKRMTRSKGKILLTSWRQFSFILFYFKKKSRRAAI